MPLLASAHKKHRAHEITSHAALCFSASTPRHLGGTADGRGLPTRHGFSTYWGMPITNVQSCRSGHQEYPQTSLFHFVATRTPTNAIFATLGLIALTPWLFRSLARWRTTGALLALGGALPVLWFTATLTLINSRSCFLYANETLIEQPAEIGYLCVPPCLALPCLASPCHALPCLAAPNTQTA